jgi:membrane-bound metal-dependent hydrolase YbcI (DUF457 family)
MALPITAYGEAAVSWLQNGILLVLLYYFKKASLIRPMLAITVVVLVATPVLLDLITPAMMAKLYDANSTIFLAARLPQIITAFREVRPLKVLTLILSKDFSFNPASWPTFQYQFESAHTDISTPSPSSFALQPFDQMVSFRRCKI